MNSSYLVRATCFFVAAILLAACTSGGAPVTGGVSGGADTTAPSVPQGVTATTQSTNSITVAWWASTDSGGSGLAGYRIYRGGAQIAQGDAATLAFTDTGLIPGTAYSYSVQAFDNAGNVSTNSSAITVTLESVPVGMTARPSNTSCVAPARPGTGGSATLSVTAALPNINFNTPISGAFMPASDSSRWYVTALDGHIYSVANSDNATSFATFADLSDRVITGGEQGLFGIAFHPNYPTNPHVYVSYTTHANGRLQSRIAAFSTTDGGATLNRATEVVLVTVNQPASNHNGGFISFGSDGYLYFGLGDGGGSGDPHGTIGNGQNTRTLLGKILRIDVNTTTGSLPYAIPGSNPFAGDAACNMDGTGTASCPEIFAYGFRNPWKGGFDRQTGQLWIADVGQDLWEEIDRVNLGGNYGWRCREGANPYNSVCGGATNLVDPVAQYKHPLGQSVVGGFVYRGSAYPSLAGRYLFADFYNRGVFSIAGTTSPTLTVTSSNLTTLGRTIVAFAQDNAGELWIVDYNGSLWRLQASSSGANTIPDDLSDTGCANPSTPAQAAAGMIPYAPNAPFWSDGANKGRWLALPNGQQIDTTGANGDWNFPSGTVLRKDFALNNRLIETRLFMRHPDGVWAGYSYEWNSAQTDATRVVGGKDEVFGTRTWHFPSEAECLQCHTAAAGYSLGIETAQLNGDYAYPASPSPPYSGVTANQVHTLNNIALLSPAIAASPSSLSAYPDPYGTTDSVANRARAYLQTNCAQCHRPGGPTPSTMDLRYQTDIASTNTCSAMPADDLGVTGSRIIDPANPGNSVLYLRVSTRGAKQMPPISTHLVDTAGVSLLNQWITHMSARCQ